MKHQQDGEMEKAKTIYREILESEIMEVVCSDGSASIATSTILKLKYIIYKNFASIARDQGDLSAAVDAYIEVLLCVSVCVLHDSSDCPIAYNYIYSSISQTPLSHLKLAKTPTLSSVCCS